MVPWIIFLSGLDQDYRFSLEQHIKYHDSENVLSINATPVAASKFGFGNVHVNIGKLPI